MDFARLRQILEDAVVPHLQNGTHAELPKRCMDLGLPTPPPLEAGSKRMRAEACWAQVTDGDLAALGQRVLDGGLVGDEQRRQLEDVLWTRLGPQVPLRIRHELAHALGGSAGDLVFGQQPFDDLLERLFLDGDGLAAAFGLTDQKKREIEQHVHRNPQGWSVYKLFEFVGAFACVDRRFCLFLEGLVSADVRPSVKAQEAFVSTVNNAVLPCRVEFRHVDEAGGYPVFRLCQMDGGVPGKPKNIIFGGAKPDLRFRDAVNNDIEIVTNADSVLVYDRPILQRGLTWADLVAWWAEKVRIQLERAAAESLYKKLRAQIPKASPPQQLLFKSFFAHFKDTLDMLPALLPEVWLHWDPKTVDQRGPAKALPRFRMDFLLLFSPLDRVVIEVDGQQHYSEGGAPSPRKYAEMVKADRALRLAGYEVYRFGGAELMRGAETEAMLSAFFDELLRRHGRAVPTGS